MTDKGGRVHPVSCDSEEGAVIGPHTEMCLSVSCSRPAFCLQTHVGAGSLRLILLCYGRQVAALGT